VTASPSGDLAFAEGHSRPGAHVDLRLEMDCLVVLNILRHPLAPSPEYTPARGRLEIRKSPPPGPDDPCRVSRPENIRAFENTEEYHRLID
jgi:uncharacterized protein YcgI (DUF1989 family)